MQKIYKQTKKIVIINITRKHNLALALVAILMAFLPFGELEGLSAPFCHLIK